MSGTEDKQLHFIIGIGRSGTTILNKVLNSHPAIHSLPEANFLVFFLNDYKNIMVFSKEQIDLIFEQIRIFSLSHPWVGWSFDAAETKRKVLERTDAGPLSYGDLCKIIYSEFKVDGFDKSDARILLDKNPAYTLFAEKIARNFSEAKFIWMLRDYRANVLSRKQNAYLKSPVVAYNAIRWKVFNIIALRFYKRYKERVLILKYEDLVSDHENSVKSVCRFLGVNPGEVFKENKPAIDLSEVNISPEHKSYFTKKYNDLNKPINTDRMNAWQTELTAGEIEECDAICSRFASKFGYNVFRPVGLARKSEILLKNARIISSSWLAIKKEQVFFYVNAGIKMKRLVKRHTDLGFIRAASGTQSEKK
ncbi:MAG TPA: sulfotransferase [Bacteroidia bacterium]